MCASPRYSHVGLPDLADNLQCLEHVYTKKSFSVYLKFKFNLASCIFPVSNCLTSFRSLLKRHLLGKAFSGLNCVNFQLPSSSPVFLLHFPNYFYTWHSSPSIRDIFYVFVYFLSPSLYVSSMMAINLYLYPSVFPVLKTNPQVIWMDRPTMYKIDEEKRHCKHTMASWFLIFLIATGMTLSLTLSFLPPTPPTPLTCTVFIVCGS